MPHSGGGGSHGGGHHSSSHHSSGSGSSRRVSNSYFNGANRYVYYYHGRPRVYYSTSPDANPRANGAGLIFFGLIWTAFSLLMVCLMAKFNPGGPLPLNYDTQIVIQDDLGMIENRQALENRIREFQQQTGITFAVMVRTPQTAEYGKNCEIQSYNAYVKNWNDESHWLIYYVGERKDRSDNWEWNLMCGDHCTRILSARQEDSFGEAFHRNLLREMSFEQAILSAMDTLKPEMKGGLVYRDNVSSNGRDVGGEKIEVTFLIFMGIFLVVGIAVLIGGFKQVLFPKEEEVARSKAIRTSDATSELREAKCRYCDGLYYVGTAVSCPHCAAPLPLPSEAELL